MRVACAGELLTGIGWLLVAVQADANGQSARCLRGIAPVPAGGVEPQRGGPGSQVLKARGREVGVAGRVAGVDRAVAASLIEEEFEARLYKQRWRVPATS